MDMWDFTIDGELVLDPIEDVLRWAARPYSAQFPAMVTGEYEEYPWWRQNYDHDNDPRTAPLDMGKHKAWDLVSPVWPWLLKPVREGEVLYAAQSSITPGGGLKVIIDHDGLGWDGWTTHYLHQLPGSLLVKAGDVVTVDTDLGEEDTSGYATGRHCHFACKNPQLAGALNLDPGLKGYVSASMFLRKPPVPAGRAWSEPISSHGFTYATYEHGGSIADFNAAMLECPAETASVTVNGQWLKFIEDAPTFVNAAFINHFSERVPAGTVMALGNL